MSLQCLSPSTEGTDWTSRGQFEGHFTWWLACWPDLWLDDLTLDVDSHWTIGLDGHWLDDLICSLTWPIGWQLAGQIVVGLGSLLNRLLLMLLAMTSMKPLSPELNLEHWSPWCFGTYSLQNRLNALELVTLLDTLDYWLFRPWLKAGFETSRWKGTVFCSWLWMNVDTLCWHELNGHTLGGKDLSLSLECFVIPNWSWHLVLLEAQWGIEALSLVDWKPLGWRARMEQMESQATIGLMFTGPTANVLKESALDLVLLATLELDLDLNWTCPRLLSLETPGISVCGTWLSCLEVQQLDCYLT